MLVTIPMWINMLLRTYAWMNLLADNGIINNLLAKNRTGTYQYDVYGFFRNGRPDLQLYALYDHSYPYILK